MPEPIATRQRLLDAGLRLFAERGFRRTTVGEIESAAGLQPRRGGLYKHFASKQALLEHGLRQQVERVAEGAAQVVALELRDVAAIDPALLRPIVTELGRWFLDELDRQRDLTHVLEHEGVHLADIAAEVRASVIDTGNRAAAELVAAADPDAADPVATAVLLLGALVALRRTTWTFGAPPLEVDDDRALAAWSDMVLAVVGVPTTR